MKDKTEFKGRPGADLEEMDLHKLKKELTEDFVEKITDEDTMSAALYPQVCSWLNFNFFFVQYK